jgi:hypothetical protein
MLSIPMIITSKSILENKITDKHTPRISEMNSSHTRSYKMTSANNGRNSNKKQTGKCKILLIRDSHIKTFK